jgi:hypothetical protein
LDNLRDKFNEFFPLVFAQENNLDSINCLCCEQPSFDIECEVDFSLSLKSQSVVAFETELRLRFQEFKLILVLVDVQESIHSNDKVTIL